MSSHPPSNEFNPTRQIVELVELHTHDVPVYNPLEGIEISPTGFIPKDGVESLRAIDRFRSVTRPLRELDEDVFGLTPKEKYPSLILARAEHYMAGGVKIEGERLRRDDAVPVIDLVNALTFVLRTKNHPAIQAVDTAVNRYREHIDEQTEADLRYQVLLATQRPIIVRVVEAYLKEYKRAKRMGAVILKAS